MSWPIRKIGNYLKITSGFAFKSSLFNQEGEGIPLIRIRDILDGKTTTYYSGDYTDEYVVKKGDLLVGMDGDFNRALWQSEDALLNQRVCKLVADEVNLEQRFLYHLLPKELLSINTNTPAVTVKHLSIKTIRDIEIPLPPLEEQKRIAAILDKAAAIRQKRQQSIELADEFLRSVFLDMFGDPVTNPKGWRLGRLGKFIITGPTNGLYKPSSEYGSGTKILRIDGFYNGKIVDQNVLKRVNVSDEEQERYSLTQRSIVINRVNSIEYLGKSAFVENLNEPTIFESNMMQFSVDEKELNARFLVYLLQTECVRRQINSCAKHAVNQASINQQDVKNFEIIIPSIEKQNQFEDMVKSHQSAKDRLVQHLINSEMLFQSLSQKAFSGEL